MALRVLLLALLCAGPAACLPIPHSHVRKPAATFVVRDTAGRPVEGAHVRVFGGYVVGKTVLWDAVLATDRRGEARLARDLERHWFMFLMPDAEAPWRWAWCAEAAGHGAAAGSLHAEPREPVAVTLPPPVPGARACPAEPRRLFDVLRPGP